MLSSTPSASCRSTQTRSLTSLGAFAPRRSVPTILNSSILQRRWLADDSTNSAASEPASSAQPPKDEEQAEEAILTSENPTDTKAPEPSTPVEAAIDTAKAATQSAVDTTKQAASSITGQAEGSSLAQAAFEAQENAPVPTVYVGNLFFDVTAETLEQKFAEVGPIKETKVMRDGRGLSKGFVDDPISPPSKKHHNADEHLPHPIHCFMSFANIFALPALATSSLKTPKPPPVPLSSSTYTISKAAASQSNILAPVPPVPQATFRHTEVPTAPAIHQPVPYSLATCPLTCRIVILTHCSGA